VLWHREIVSGIAPRSFIDLFALELDSLRLLPLSLALRRAVHQTGRKEEQVVWEWEWAGSGVARTPGMVTLAAPASGSMSARRVESKPLAEQRA
jgi:hypothetical protein